LQVFTTAQNRLISSITNLFPAILLRGLAFAFHRCRQNLVWYCVRRPPNIIGMRLNKVRQSYNHTNSRFPVQISDGMFIPGPQHRDQIASLAEGDPGVSASKTDILVRSSRAECISTVTGMDSLGRGVGQRPPQGRTPRANSN
jgi:hypothetical protein